MSVSYVTQKCTSCAGTKLEYIKELKSWKCLYCGTLIERHEQVDSLFTIKNVIRQCLIDIAYKRMDSAEKNLVECKKIDSYYIGTYICETAYYLNMMASANIPKSEQRNCFGQMKKSYLKLKELGDIPNEEETALYEFLNSAEAIGVLTLMFDALNAIQRRDFLLELFEPSEIYSMDLNSQIVNFALKNEKYDILDIVVKNTDNINKKSVLKSIAERYPDNENKANNMTALINSIQDFEDEDKHWFEKYLNNTNDSVTVKAAVVQALSSTFARPSIECIMSNVIVELDDADMLLDLIKKIINKSLNDREVNTILEYAINNCSDESCNSILEILKGSGIFVSLNAVQLKNVLSRDSSVKMRIQILENALAMNVSDKDREQFIAMYLCEVYDTPENREEMIKFLLGKIDTLSSAAIEKYLTSCNIDKEIKPDIVKQIFKMKINNSFLRKTLSNYLISMTDDFNIKCAIVRVLCEAGLQAETNGCIRMLMNIKLSVDQRISLFRELKYSGLDVNEILSSYLNAAGAGFDSQIFAELLSGANVVSEDILARYTLYVADYSAAKVSKVRDMMSKCGSSADDISVSVNHNGNVILSSLVIGYMLCTPDDDETSLSVAEVLHSNSMNSTALINVSGSPVKLKKYIVSQQKKGLLKSASQSICKQYKIL